MENKEKPWLNKWAEVGPVGRGGQGVLYMLHSKADPSKTAVLKRLGPRWAGVKLAAERMENEVRSMIKLNSINGTRVPKVFDSFLDHEGSEPYFIMEYIKGKLFSDWLREIGFVDIATARVVTVGVAETIRHCHNEKIGHRDLKPANIILRDGDPANSYVLDFGISFDSLNSVMPTKDGDVFFNEFLTLPENLDQLGGHRDPRSDVTALAGVFFNCITGERPGPLIDGNGNSPQRRFIDKLRSISDDPITNMRLIEFFNTAFAVAINNRFQNLDEFLDRLSRIESTEQSLESISYLTHAFEKKLLERDRGAQLIALRKAANPLLQEIVKVISKSIHLESASNSKLTSFSTDRTTGLFGDLENVNIVELKKYDRIINTLTLLRIRNNNHDRVAVSAIVPLAVEMRIHLLVGSWIAANENSSHTPIGRIKWVHSGSIEIDLPKEEREVLIESVVKLVSSGLQSQIVSLLIMLDEPTVKID